MHTNRHNLQETKGISFELNNIRTLVEAGMPPFTKRDGIANFETPKDFSIHAIHNFNFITAVKNPKYNRWFIRPIIPYAAFNFNPGPINSSLGSNQLFMAKVSQADIEKHKTSFNSNSYNMPEGIKNWPATGDSTVGMATDLAPFVDVNQNGCYDPENGDYPIIKGEEALY